MPISRHPHLSVFPAALLSFDAAFRYDTSMTVVAFSIYRMLSSTLSSLTLVVTILIMSHHARAQAQGYGCPKSCTDCKSYTSDQGGPFVPQVFCDNTENCFGGYQCFLEYGAPNIIPSDTPFQEQGPTWPNDDQPNCCTPVDMCQFAASNTAGSLTDYESDGTNHSATDTSTVGQSADAQNTQQLVYCVDCFEGQYASDDSSGNPIFSCTSGWSSDATATQCIPPVPDTCAPNMYPIKGGECSVTIMQYQQASPTQGWWAFDIYFYDALWVSLPNPQTLGRCSTDVACGCADAILHDWRCYSGRGWQHPIWSTPTAV